MKTSVNKTVAKNETIIKQGDIGSSAYIIEKGTVEILIEKEKGLVQTIGTRGPGALIGEMALIDQKTRTASVIAKEDCQLIEISLNDFERRLDTCDPIIKLVTQVIMTRYRDMVKYAHIMKPPVADSKAEEAEIRFLKQSDAFNSVKMEKELEKAFKNNQLHLNYQPIFDIESGHTVGLEALLRWNHPKLGFIPPDVFIPIAEETRLIIDISQWVLETSCHMLKKLDDSFPDKPALFMSVNFSSIDLTENAFSHNFFKILKSLAIEPSRIHLEMTERLLIDNPEKAKETLYFCQEEGISISIDDFGTGYSSLSYLHYFPINILKIDRSFVNNMQSDGTAIEIIRSIISLGQTMGMKIIAEGIETEDQLNLLKAMGCDSGQGYFYAKPMTEKDLLDFLSSANT